MTVFRDDMTLAEARDALRELVEEGHRCPCCTQYAKVYRWALYRGAIGFLSRLYRAGGTTEFVDSKLVKLPGQGGDGSRLRNFGLVEQESQRRPDGGKSGWWRVTAEGERFLRGQHAVPKYVYVYDNRVLRRDGPDVMARDIDTDFDYALFVL